MLDHIYISVSDVPRSKGALLLGQLAIRTSSWSMRGVDVMQPWEPSTSTLPDGRGPSGLPGWRELGSYDSKQKPIPRTDESMGA